MRRKDELLTALRLRSLPLVKLVDVINQPLGILKYRDGHLERAGEQEGQWQPPPRQTGINTTVSLGHRNKTHESRAQAVCSILQSSGLFATVPNNLFNN